MIVVVFVVNYVFVLTERAKLCHTIVVEACHFHVHAVAGAAVPVAGLLLLLLLWFL